MDTETKLLSRIYLKEGVFLRELCRLMDVSMPTIEQHVKKLENIGLIIRKKEGKNVKLYLNWGNTAIVPSLYAVQYGLLSELPEKARTSVIEFLNQLTSKPVLAAIFGSYAKGTYDAETSDVDLFLVFNRIEKENKEEIENKVKAARYRHGIEISPVYVSFDEFKRKFFDESDRFMRELNEHKIIIHGVEWWVMLENEKR